MLQAVADDDRPDTVKVLSLLKAVVPLPASEGAIQRYLISIGNKAEESSRLQHDRDCTVFRVA